MSRVFWDTNLFIYLLEDYGSLTDTVFHLRRRMITRGDQLYTSFFTMGELLIKPVARNDDRSIQFYRESLERGATLLPFSEDAAMHYARIRRDKTIKAPDAIQLSCAAQADMDMFITNDDHLSGKSVAGIQFIMPLAAAAL